MINPPLHSSHQSKSAMCPLSSYLPVSLSTYAKATIREIAPYVMSVAISDISGEGKMFLNLTTKEGKQFTVEQSSIGFQVITMSKTSVLSTSVC